MVVWIIGLSGAGKSTLANEVVKQVRARREKVVLLDGDEVRSVFGNDLGHSMEDRLANAKRLCRLGKLLDDQDVHAVCAILSLFPETRQWNRDNLKYYHEVFIDTPIEDLVKRDSKGLYEKFNSGKISNVAGMDIEFPVPKHADYVIENAASRDELLSHAAAIVEKILSDVR